jgi:type I restriction enzyme R subunit
MLETGVNVPEAVNLVFMRPVQSRIKLEQMIGRGTRTNEACKHPEWLPDGYKDKFLILDFWDNDFEKDHETELKQSLPVLVTIFNTRLKLLAHFLENQQAPDAKKVIEDLRAMIELIPIDSFLVKKVFSQVERAWEDGFWRYITKADIEFLRTQVAPLLRYAPGVDVPAQTFTSKVERLKLQIVIGENPQSTAQSIAEDVSKLPDFVYENHGRKEPAELCLTPDLLTASVEQLNQVIEALADQMKYRRQEGAEVDMLDLTDVIATSGYIVLRDRPEPVFYEEYRRMVTDKVLALIDKHPTILAIDRGKPVSDMQLLELERTLQQELGGSDMELTGENIRRAYRMQVTSMLEFLRNLLELEDIPTYEEIVDRQFSGFIANHAFNGNQIRFLRGVQSVFLQKRRLELADLYEPPLTSFGTDAVERWFSKKEVSEMIKLARKLELGS